MRVLLAIDGSPGASVATDLTASLDWPVDSTVRVVSVLGDQAGIFGAPWVPAAPAEFQRLEDELLAMLRDSLDGAAAAIARPGVTIEHELLRGRAASCIVEEASQFRADLVIMGSRGHGAFETTLLGSVSAEVADHAACPVLIARRRSVHNVLLADDGSPDSDNARRVVRDWPILRSLPVRVVSVGNIPVPWESSVSPMAVSFEAEGFEIAMAENRRVHTEIAKHAHDELAVGGRLVEGSVRVGSPARELVAAATDWDADLIVVGSHGRTGLGRILLGSVARSVLVHAPCSVLIVRRQAVDHVAESEHPTGDLIAV